MQHPKTSAPQFNITMRVSRDACAGTGYLDSSLDNLSIPHHIRFVIDGEPFQAHEAKRRIRQILHEGFVDWELPHFRDELRKDRLDMVDAVNCLRAGIVEEAEMDSGEWRYRIRTQKICLLVQFEAEDELLVITIWRLRR